MKLNYIFIISVLLIGLFSCKKETVMTYNSENSIYFAPSVIYSTPFDSTNISFAFAGGEAKDSTIRVIVCVTGATSTVDRAYSIVIDKDSSTAIAGTHFVEPAAVQYIKAGNVRDTINLKLLRTQNMQDNSFKIIFKLKPNENFNTNMNFKILSSVRTLNYVRYTVYINDILKKPGRWLDTYLGDFTRKKLFMICELLNTTPAYIDTQAAVSDIIFYGKWMQRYLNQMKADGNTVYEADGVTEMKMGPSVQ